MQSFKYPSTPHLPGSGSRTSDDTEATALALKTLGDGRELVVTEKMDGGNVSLYADDFHARSLDAKSQPWDSAAKAIWAGVRSSIPEDIKISGESLHARRSVSYDSLESPLLVFGVWRNTTLLPWSEGVALVESLGLSVVPVLYRGCVLEDALKAWRESGATEETSEGFVVRDAGSVPLESFASHVAKWVRKNHVQTSDDWRRRTTYDRNGFASA